MNLSSVSFLLFAFSGAVFGRSLLTFNGSTPVYDVNNNSSLLSPKAEIGNHRRHRRTFNKTSPLVSMESNKNLSFYEKDTLLENDDDGRLDLSYGQKQLEFAAPKLIFEIDTSCMGTFSVCYDVEKKHEPPNVAEELCSGKNQCGFKYEGDVSGRGNRIRINKLLIERSFLTDAGGKKQEVYQLEMKEGRVMLTSFDYFFSCSPKFSDGDKLLNLFVERNDCPQFRIIGAKDFPHTTTSSAAGTTTREDGGSGSGENGSNGQNKSSEAAFPLYGYLIIGIGGLALFILIASLLLYCCYRKYKAARSPGDSAYSLNILPTQNGPGYVPPPPPTPEEVKEAMKRAPKSKKNTKVAAPALPVAAEKVPEKIKAETPPPPAVPASVEKAVEKKKQTPPKVNSPKKTAKEQAPVPPAKVQSSQLQKIQSLSAKLAARKKKKNAGIDSQPKPPRVVSPTPEKKAYDLKHPLLESATLSLRNVCMKSEDSEEYEDMKKFYPDEIMLASRSSPYEPVLYSESISKMVEGLEENIGYFERSLKKKGVVFDEESRILKVSQAARQYLMDPSTLTLLVYFAFGAEYHKYLDPEQIIGKKDEPAELIFENYSVPLLLVVALQPRFSQEIRSKACSMLRQDLAKIYQKYPECVRQNLPYPCPVLTEAYKNYSKFFEYPGRLDDSFCSVDNERHPSVTRKLRMPKSRL